MRLWLLKDVESWDFFFPFKMGGIAACFLFLEMTQKSENILNTGGKENCRST